jgi:outer membrane protein assembly factor BamB
VVAPGGLAVSAQSGNDYNKWTMKTSWIPTIVPTALATFGFALLIAWMGGSDSLALKTRDPGLDGTPAPSINANQGPSVAGKPVRGEGQPADISGAWPAFRGVDRDAICDDGVPLARSWPPDGPPVMWQITLEEGYAGAAVRDGCVYVLDYDVEAQADTMRCLSLADGREIWRNGYPVTITPNHGITRTVPALVDDCVVSIGPRCHVACWDARTGECRWLEDMVREFGAEERTWYTGQCPLVDGDRLILAPCGPDAMLMATDYRTGEVIWRSPNPRGWKMTHSSIMPLEFAGRRIYVYCGTGGTAGVSAEDGALLWDETSWVERFATSPSPLPLPEGRIFLCSGYDMTGAIMLQMKAAGDSLSVETAFTLKRKQFNSEQQTPVFYQGHLYGVRKVRGRMLCMDLQGNEVWNSGDLKFGHGPYMIGDGLLIALADDGLLVIMEATAAGFRPLAQHQVFQDGIEAWGPMALVDGRLIVRDLRRMACLDLRAAAAKSR